MPDNSKPQVRTINARRWVAVGTAAGAALATISTASAFQASLVHHVENVGTVILASSEGGEGGEGGEGIKKSSRGEMHDDDFLAGLGFIEGHLTSGSMLYEQGFKDMAITHMKHPGDEIYTELKPALKARNIKGFERELEALAAAVEGDKGNDAVKQAFETVKARLSDARKAAKASDHEEFEAIAKLVKTAAEEYGVGVKDGAIGNIHEYQDAWGFLQIARQMTDRLAVEHEPEVQEASAAIISELNKLDAAFRSLVPKGKIETDPSVLFGAAARIEIAALKVK